MPRKEKAIPPPPMPNEGKKFSPRCAAWRVLVVPLAGSLRLTIELSALPSPRTLLPAVDRELKEFGRLGTHMDQFHAHFRHEYVSLPPSS